MLLVGWQEGHPASKKTEWWGAGMVICLERWADLPLPLTISCSNKIQVGFTFLVPAHLGSPGQRAVKCVCVCICYGDVSASGQYEQALQQYNMLHDINSFHLVCGRAVCHFKLGNFSNSRKGC